MGARMEQSESLLLGRRTYLDLLTYRNTHVDGRSTEALNGAQKYVASHTLEEPLPWPRSSLLRGDAAEAVVDLKRKPGKDLHIMGSGALIQSLLPQDLIDEFMLMIHPLVLGAGQRLFRDGGPRTPLRLVESVSTTAGVVIATYQPASRA
jgi:dihydrofolate reductase